MGLYDVLCRFKVGRNSDFAALTREKSCSLFWLLGQPGAAVTAYKCPSCSMYRFESIDHVMDCRIDGDDIVKTFFSIVGNF